MTTKDRERVVNTMIYADPEFLYNEDLAKRIAQAEKALGFDLFFWQKTYIGNGYFRCYGETTAKILRELLTDIDAVPINCRIARALPTKRWYYDELLRVYYILRDAGVPTRMVVTDIKPKSQTPSWREQDKLAESIADVALSLAQKTDISPQMLQAAINNKCGEKQED